jgi:hypothetical protein
LKVLKAVKCLFSRVSQKPLVRTATEIMAELITEALAAVAVAVEAAEVAELQCRPVASLDVKAAAYGKRS